MAGDLHVISRYPHREHKSYPGAEPMRSYKDLLLAAATIAKISLVIPEMALASILVPEGAMPGLGECYAVSRTSPPAIFYDGLLSPADSLPVGYINIIPGQSERECEHHDLGFTR